MLRFFRKYIMNKWVLAIGMCLLMVMFLLPQGGGGGGGRGDYTIGRIDGQKLRESDRMRAVSELSVLRAVSPGLAAVAAHDAWQWLFMQREAQLMGMGSSETEAVELLTAMGMSDDADLAAIAKRLHVPTAVVLQTLQDFLTIEKYKQLLYGFAEAGPIAPTRTQFDLQQLAMRMMTAEMRDQGELYFLASSTAPTLSEPLLERFVADHGVTVDVNVVLIAAEQYLNKVEAPDDAAVQALYEQYKDNLPGEGEPYGFGFKTPDRVKIEYLVLPVQRLEDKVDVTEAEALDYYAKNKDMFRDQEAEQASATGQMTVYRPYREVRQTVLRLVRAEKAAALGDQMIAKARAMLLIDDLRGFEQREGYYDLPEDWSPTPLRTVAEQLQSEFDVLPDLYIKDRNWLTTTDLQHLPKIGQAFALHSGMPVGLVNYVMTLREFNPDTSGPLMAERLQLKLPGRALTDVDGSRYVFRVIDAEAQRSPESLDEVRESVAVAARRLAAYRLMCEQHRDAWLTRAQTEPLEQIGQELGAVPIATPSLTRRQFVAGQITTANVQGVGRDETLINALFEQVDQLSPSMPVDQHPMQRRVVAAPVDGKLSLALVRIDRVTPLTESLYRQMAISPETALDVNIALLPIGAASPIAVDRIIERIGFVPEHQAEPATSQDTEGKAVPVDIEY